VDDVCRPIFGISRPTVRPGPRSATKALTPRDPGPSVRANSMNSSAKPPLVIHCLLPRARYVPSSWRSATVRRAAVSDPMSGSVSAYDPKRRPAARSGSQRSCCSRVPNFMIGTVASPFWAATAAEVPASAAASSSTMSAREVASRPAPPRSSGTVTPRKPRSPMRDSTSSGTWWRAFQSAACGAISSRAKSRARACTARWESVSSGAITLSASQHSSRIVALAMPPPSHIACRP
jgi:hypothetical protein